MPIFKITDLFKITGVGNVLTGFIVDKGIVLIGDKAFLTIGNDLIAFEIIGVTMAKEKNNYGLLISFSDFEKLNKYDLKDREIKIVNTEPTKEFTYNPIEWKETLLRILLENGYINFRTATITLRLQ